MWTVIVVSVVAVVAVLVVAQQLGGSDLCR